MPIYAETCPQYLNLTYDDLVRMESSSYGWLLTGCSKNSTLRPALRTVSTSALLLRRLEHLITMSSTCESDVINTVYAYI